jgi:hypothetical protein
MKVLVVSGWLFSFSLGQIQAATLSYSGVDPQGHPASSQITVLEQRGDLFHLQIEGGMPDINPLTGSAYLRTLRFSDPPNHQATYALFVDPFLYILTPAQITKQKVMVAVNQLYVFFWQGQDQFQLVRFFRDGLFCGSQPCAYPNEGLFCDDAPCQLISETVPFETPVIYLYSTE